MKASFVALALSALSAVSAAPLNARNNGGGKKSGGDMSDIDVTSEP